MTTGSFPKSLWPGVNKFYGKAYAEHPVEYTKLFDTFQSRRAYEEDVGVSSFGLLSVKPEAGAIVYDDEQQAFTIRYSHVNYALGFIISEEAMDDDLYDIVGERRARGLAFSMRQTKEIIAANVYNRAFNASYEGGDGVSLVACATTTDTSHPNVAGGTWTNGPSVASDLNEAALEQAYIDIAAWTNDRGLKIAVMPKTLIVPPALTFEADRFLNTPLRVGTADNDINSLKNMGKFPGGVIVNHYLTDSDAWFIRTNAPDGMKHFVRKSDTFAMDNDFDTNNAKFKGSFRCSFGWTDPRAIYGSAGA
jgi:hypothetical protein